MNPQNARRLDLLDRQFNDFLMSAALCAKEIIAIVRDDLDGRHENALWPFPTTRSRKVPLLDDDTLCVFWEGKSIHLGHTLVFRLLQRLARRPRHYVTHLDLAQDVWDKEDLAPATIRSVVRNLRQQLRAGGMPELAIAIRGHNGRYVLDL